ncbi:hypothetical protein QJS66_10020 [Kocuria rhizophila]|nr:hypothetical protein QJS66_10020 [Kocuria rhizophila]
MPATDELSPPDLLLAGLTQVRHGARDRRGDGHGGVGGPRRCPSCSRCWALDRGTAQWLRLLPAVALVWGGINLARRPQGAGDRLCGGTHRAAAAGPARIVTAVPTVMTVRGHQDRAPAQRVQPRAPLPAHGRRDWPPRRPGLPREEADRLRGSHGARESTRRACDGPGLRRRQHPRNGAGHAPEMTARGDAEGVWHRVHPLTRFSCAAGCCSWPWCGASATRSRTTSCPRWSSTEPLEVERERGRSRSSAWAWRSPARRAAPGRAIAWVCSPGGSSATRSTDTTCASAAGGRPAPQRQARLDRVQGIDIERRFLPRSWPRVPQVRRGRWWLSVLELLLPRAEHAQQLRRQLRLPPSARRPTTSGPRPRRRTGRPPAPIRGGATVGTGTGSRAAPWRWPPRTAGWRRPLRCGRGAAVRTPHRHGPAHGRRRPAEPAGRGACSSCPRRVLLGRLLAARGAGADRR